MEPALAGHLAGYGYFDTGGMLFVLDFIDAPAAADYLDHNGYRCTNGGRFDTERGCRSNAEHQP